MEKYSPGNLFRHKTMQGTSAIIIRSAIAAPFRILDACNERVLTAGKDITPQAFFIKSGEGEVTTS